MFQSHAYNKRVSQLRDFLIQVADRIIQAPNVQQKSFKLRINYLPAYTFVYDLCNQKPSLQQKMLQQFKSSLSYVIQTYITQNAKTNPFQFKIQNSNKTIEWLNNLWSKFVKFMIIISKKVFAYLDRYYMPGQEENNLYKVGLNLFKKNVFHESNARYFQNCYFKQLRQVIIRQRRLIQNDYLRKYSEIIFMINVQRSYQQLIKRYFQQTTVYWESVFKNSSKTLTCFQYYSKVYNTYLFQKNLIQMSCCLSLGEIEQYFNIFGDILVKQYTDVFVSVQTNHGIVQMFQKKNIDFMVTVNHIYQKFEGFQKIRQAYYNYIISQSQQVLAKKQQTQSNCQQSTVHLIYQFYKHHLNLITIGFNKRNQLFITLNNAIQKIITKNDTFTQQLFKYCSQIRKQNTFSQQNKQKIKVMLGKISSKDQFISLYENQLVNKIFNGDVVIESEEEFVVFLDEIFENQLTHKLMKKLKDYKQLPNKYQLTLGLPYHITFNISILSLHLWQKKFNDQLTLNINLPSSLQILWKSIQRNFIYKQPKKKLLVLPFQNKLLLEVRFNHKIFMMKCNLIQACLFMYLSQKSYASEQQIILNLMVEKTVLQNIIQTLQSVPNLIIRTGLGDYLINWNFTQNETTIDLASKIQQSKHINKAIKQDRQILIQAAIVKFIKRSKQAMFQEITQGVNKAIRLFKPQPSGIKLAVQKLIKKGFIEEKQNGALEYVE